MKKLLLVLLFLVFGINESQSQMQIVSCVSSTSAWSCNYDLCENFEGSTAGGTGCTGLGSFDNSGWTCNVVGTLTADSTTHEECGWSSDAQSLQISTTDGQVAYIVQDLLETKTEFGIYMKFRVNTMPDTDYERTELLWLQNVLGETTVLIQINKEIGVNGYNLFMMYDGPWYSSTVLNTAPISPGSTWHTLKLRWNDGTSIYAQVDAMTEFYDITGITSSTGPRYVRIGPWYTVAEYADNVDMNIDCLQITYSDEYPDGA